MGYTNKTSHYELPQYVANDKPSWLGDFNAAMLKIDTVMADNDATAEAANSAATGAQTQVAALSAQFSTIQGQVNTAVDTATTADGKATTAQSVATQASTTAGEAKTLAETAKQSADLALPIGGGTMTGDLILNGAPTVDNQAATKAYVDSKASGGVENVTITPNSTNVQTNGTQFKANCRKQGGVYTFQINSIVMLSGKSPINPTYSSWFELFSIAGNPFGVTSNEIGNIYNCYVGTTSKDGTDSLPVIAWSDGNKTMICVRIGSGTSVTGSIGSLTFTLMEKP